MSPIDRIGRSVFVALAVGLGWGIRGDFGHLVGAMFPGAALALGLAFVSGQRSLFLWMPIISALSAMGIGAGGTMSYGILHGYAQADTLVNYAYGFATLFLQGAAWGTFGGALVGLMLERQPMRSDEWLGLAASLLAGGWFTSLLVVDFLGFDINPPRNNISITFFGAALGQLIWLACNRKPVGLRGALLGYLGFGLGMSGGRLLGNLANLLQTSNLDFTINHWNVMETSCGMIGGFIYTFGMVNRAYPAPPERKNVTWASVLGIVYVLGVIPLWHRLSRIRPDEKIEAWAAQFRGFGFDNPQEQAELVLARLDAVCVFGFVGAALWIVIYLRRWQALAALPVLWLSLTMLLFQNLNALYFWYPAKPGQFNMHNLFWVLWALMAAYALVATLRGLQPAAQPVERELPDEPTSLLAVWTAAALVALGLFIAAAGFVNGEQTMKSANTRWPRWTWSEGPFPRQAQPHPAQSSR